jgi:hypothetical protein
VQVHVHVQRSTTLSLFLAIVFSSTKLCDKALLTSAAWLTSWVGHYVKGIPPCNSIPHGNSTEPGASHHVFGQHGPAISLSFFFWEHT